MHQKLDYFTIDFYANLRIECRTANSLPLLNIS